MRTLTLLAFALALLLPAGAWAATCTFDPLPVTWGPIGDVTGDCQEGPAPTGADNIICPYGCTATTDAHIAYDTAGSSLTIQGGGELVLNAATMQNSALIHFFNGKDGVSVGGVSYDEVSLSIEPGGRVTTQAGYLTWGLATPVYRTTVTEDNYTMLTVDLFAPCDEAAANIDAFDIGGDKTCTSGNQAYGFSIVYTADRNDPQAGCGTGCGDNYIDEFMTHLSGKDHKHYLGCFTTGLEANHCYTFIDGDIDATGPEFAMTLFVPQMAQGGALTSLSYPLADRTQARLAVLTAAAAGDTCIETTAAATLGADGEFVNACMYIYDTNGENGLHRPKRIVRTEDGENCAGDAGGDAWHFASDDPLLAAVPQNAQMVVSPLCVGQGDKFSVKAGVWFEMEETSGWALGNSKILCDDCYFTGRGLVVTGSGLILCEGSGCLWDVDDSQFWGCGDSEGPPLHFKNANSAIMSCSSVIGGPQTAGGPGIAFEGVDVTRMTDISTRYISGDSFYSINSSMNTAYFERVSCERIGRIAASNDNHCFDVADDWDYVTIVDLFVGDWGYGTGLSDIVSSTGSTVTVNGVAIAGQTSGGYSNTASSPYVTNTGLLVRGVDTTRSNNALGWVGSNLGYSDIREFEVAYTKARPFAVAGEIDFTNNYIENFTTTEYYIFEVTDTDGIDVFRNNIILNADTTDRGSVCSTNSNCAVFYVISDDDDTDTPNVIEQNQVMWDSGDTNFINAFESESSTGDSLYFGGNLVSNMVSDLANVTVAGIDLDADIAAGSIQRNMGGGNVLNNCVSYVDATDGTSTTVYVANANSFPNTPFVGIDPGFEKDGKTLQQNSFSRQQLCGAQIGTQRPGMPVGHDWLYQKMGIEKPERKPLVKYDEGGAY